MQDVLKKIYRVAFTFSYRDAYNLRQEVPNMTPQEVIQHFGTQVKAAQALGIKQSSVAGWIKNGVVPEGRQYQIQLLTGGQLRADQKAA